MNILIAIDSFKGSLTSTELASEIESGINSVSSDFNVSKTSIADGGEGTCETLLNEFSGKKIKVNVKDPLFENVLAEYGILEDGTAVIEMAAASGLTLVQDQFRNPMNTTTFGVGQLIEDAINKGCKNFIIGIGGSATNDGGIGMLNALGYKFLDHSGNELVPTGASLENIFQIDSKNILKNLSQCNFLIACDVDNPLYGPLGAAHIYAKQKGATSEEILILDKGLKNFAEKTKSKLNIEVSNDNGAGAAGGLGFGLKAFLNAELKSGVNILIEKLNLEEKIKNADIIITGEGRLDNQTTMGKVPVGISNIAKKYNKTVIALAGSVTDDAIKLHDFGVTSMFSIIDSPMNLEIAMNKKNAKNLIRKSIVEIFRLINSLKNG